ncbi:MAG: glycosyltransferase [Acidimicrobiales bacterium]|nr:glycosyltransferase [Acidimicrobiales bacterium]
MGSSEGVPTVDVVLIHWKQPEACVHSLKRFGSEPAVRSITVVDNGSSQDAVRQIQAALNESSKPGKLIELDSNTGFGPATNRGWERWLEDPTGAEWCVAAPHDALPDHGTLTTMLAIAAERPRLGLLGADVGDGLLPRIDRNFGPIFVPAGSDGGFEACDYPHGTLFMARRSCLEDIGLYDERFFTYCEEADLGLRATAAGWEVGLARGARVYNPRVSTPKPVAEYLMERNTLLLIGKHFGRFHLAVRAVLAIGQLIDGTTRPSRRGEYWSARARLRALRDAARGRWGAP